MFMENSMGQVDLPDCTVSEESNSNPLENIWSVYDRVLRNDLVGFSRTINYAGRGSYKTLGAAVLEVMVLLHTPRNVAHMAAQSAQSQYAAAYVKDFFQGEILRDFVVEQNTTGLKIIRFIHHTTGEVLTLQEFTERGESEVNYTRYGNFLRLIICTMAGANSTHVEFMCVDGDTKILAKYTDNGTGSNRKRRARTARGLYRELAGMSHGGRGDVAGSEPSIIEIPSGLVEVASYDWQTGAMEFQPLAGGVRRTEECVEVSREGGRLVCSSSHLVWTKRGFVSAQDLKVTDVLLVMNKAKTESKRAAGRPVPSPISTIAPSTGEWDYWEQIVLGSLMGDCGIYKKISNNPYLREQHCVDQKGYLDWKWNVISQRIRTHPTTATSGFTGAEMPAYQSGCSPLLLPYKDIRTSLDGIERLEAPGLAIWYQDDGCAGNSFRISTEGFTHEQNYKISEFLSRKFHIETTVSSYERDGSVYYYIHGGVEAKRRLVELCSEWIHPSMAYKFDLSANTGICIHCGAEFWFYQQGTGSKTCGSPLCRHLQMGTLKYANVLGVKSVGPKVVYDFVVQKNHNFWTNGILSKNCVDEVDVIPTQYIPAYYQAQNIPDPREGMLPLTMLTSTRKLRTGLVQKELDEAERTNLHVRHWNVIDVTQACSADRHHPELPKQKYYVNDDLVKHITSEEYEVMNPGQQKAWYCVEGFEGCRGCRIFPACKSRLATHQTSTSKLLKPITWVLEKFQNAPTPEFISTEYLCRKAMATGLVYSRITRDKHWKSAAEMALLITGDEYPADMGKAALIALLKQKGAVFCTGMDFGFSHNFATVTFAIFGQYVFVLDCFAQAGLQLDEQTASCEYLKTVYDNPVIYPDPAYPASIKTFRTRGFKARDWEKKPFSVKAGIEIVRSLLWSGSGLVRMMFLKGDSGVEFLLIRAEKYKYKVDATGTPTEEPDEKDDDELDALRYGIMNALGSEGALKEKKSAIVRESNAAAPLTSQAAAQQASVAQPGIQQQWLVNEIRSLTGQQTQVKDGVVSTGSIKKNRFIFDV
jgi:hypothetical protein